MNAPQTDATTDPQNIISLQRKLDAALTREAALTEELAARTAELAERNTEHSERIKQQAGTGGDAEALASENQELRAAQAAGLVVLQAMIASPGDTQPVFDLIARQAADLCVASAAAVAMLDGTTLHLATQYGYDAEFASVYATQFPRSVGRDTVMGRAILGRRVEQIEDLAAEPAYGMARAPCRWSTMAVPLLRGAAPLGVIAVGRPVVGRFPNNQVTLLQTFAEQAVIAITSAETYRALQTRTSDLQETLEYQTATSDVLRVISSSNFALEPVFQTVVETAARLCRADHAVIFRLQDDAFRWAAGTDMLPEFERRMRTSVVRPGTGSLIGRVALQGRPVQILDRWTDPLSSPEAKDSARIGGVRSALGVPLVRDGVTIGAMGLNRLRVEPFTDRQIELVCTFADQAVIAIENTRLMTEQREALEQQTATADVLAVINASPGNLTPVFDTILDKAHTLCGAIIGSLSTYDGEYMRVVAAHGYPTDYDATFLPPVRPSPAASQRLIDGDRFVHVTDMQELRPRPEGNFGRMIERTGLRTALMIPLRKDGAFIGQISASSTEVRAFSDKQIALLENFAAQAVIAMENARLLTEQREALEQQTATAEVLGVINASPGDLAPVFEAILEKAHGLCGADTGSLQINEGELMRAVATRGLPEQQVERLRQGVRPSVVHPMSRPLNGADFIQIPDISELDNPLMRIAYQVGGIRTYLSVPLRNDDRLLGRIVAGRRQVRPFTDKQIALLQNFAAQAVIAMENARLLDEIRQRQDELRITFENMGDGVAMFDESQRLVAWNHNFQELLDIPDAILDEHPSYTNYLHLLAERGEFGTEDVGVELARRLEHTERELRLERTRPDGRVIEVRRNAVPDGGFVLIYSDITERKRSEEEVRAARDASDAALRELKAAQANLIQAEKMASLGQLTAGIAHEIKNPLNFVNNFASLSVDLLDELKQTAAPGLAVLEEASRVEFDELANTLASNLDKINEHGRRADGIVRGMLEHSRGSSGERRQVELNALVDEALNLAYHGARAQDQSFNVTLQRDFGDGIAPIMLAPQDVTRVLLNLFSNGFYAARERQRTEATAGFDPTLKVSTRRLDGAVEIRVRDNGIGIPPEMKDRLFQPFFTTKPPGEGTGLGLSMSYDIVTQQHGGSITVNSKVGEYSEFTIRLPRRP